MGCLYTLPLRMFYTSDPIFAALQDFLRKTENTLELTITGLMIAPVMLPVALVFGIIGLIQKKHKKTFAWLGVVISLSIPLLVIYLFFAFITSLPENHL